LVVDAGTSDGVMDLKHGYWLMIGGHIEK